MNLNMADKAAKLYHSGGGFRVTFVALYAWMHYTGGSKDAREIAEGVGGVVHKIERALVNMHRVNLVYVNAVKSGSSNGALKYVFATGEARLGNASPRTTRIGNDQRAHMQRLADVVGRNGEKKRAETLAKLTSDHRLIGELNAISALCLADVGQKIRTAVVIADAALFERSRHGAINGWSPAKVAQVNIMRALCGMGAVEVA